MKKILRLLSFMLIITMLFSTVPASALEPTSSASWQSKVSAELLEVMQTKSDSDLIPVYIWLKDIDEDVINKALKEEKGMDPEVYENVERFYKEIVPSIEEQIVSRVGYEAAHAKVEESEYVLDENGAYHDDTMSLVERAVKAKENEYVMTRRSIVRREYSFLTNEFVDDNVPEGRKLVYKGVYDSTVIAEATKAEIEKYAKLSEVNDISLYVEYEFVSDMTTAANQVEAGYSGTKGIGFNEGAGLKGTDIKIGIIEEGIGMFDRSAPHLSGVPLTRLVYLNNISVDGTSVSGVEDDHATMVTSIIVGQPVTVDGVTYEGVVPLATVFQTSANSISGMYTAYTLLATEGVSVINMSASVIKDGVGYSEIDRRFDTLIHNTGVTLVCSAGNKIGLSNLRSPGKALNTITVGNAETLSSSHISLSSPYAVNDSSLYLEAPYLPNKPDIVAPGSYIRVVKSETGTQNFFLTFNNNGDLVLPSGTSFSAPIVTGIVAQMQQAGSVQFKTWPALVKSALVTSAKPNQIRTSTSTPADTDNTQVASGLWEKSGAGMVNALLAVTIAQSTAKWNTSFFYDVYGQVHTTSEKYFEAGDKLRVSLAYEKITDTLITSISQYDDINLRVIDSEGNVIASAVEPGNNVVVVSCVIPEDGYYRFRIDCPLFVHQPLDNIHFYYSYQVT